MEDNDNVSDIRLYVTIYIFPLYLSTQDECLVIEVTLYLSSTNQVYLENILQG